MTGTMKTAPARDEDAWDEPQDDGPRTNVVWGRVLVFSSLLVVSFVLGRVTAGGGPSESDLQALRAELREVTAENEELENELATTALLEETQTPAPEPKDDEAAASGGGDEDDATDPVGEDEGLRYKVQRGDTLRAIARTFCGDPELAGAIAAKNNINDPKSLTAGQLLTLPAECAG